MKVFVDALRREVPMPFPPKRIVSLSPAITETMFHLGLEEEIVGRTRFCIHPEDKVEKAMNVGGTKDMKIERIKALDPHLIIAEKEENTKEMVEELERFFPVYVFQIESIKDALQMIKTLGRLTNRSMQANQMVLNIKQNFKQLPKVNSLRIAYIIWQNPYMVVGEPTYINSLLSYMGFENPFIFFDGRYPEVSIKDLQSTNLDYIFLATEPFPFDKKHLDEFQKLLPNTTPLIVDGEKFWYGYKMLEATEYIQHKFSKLTR